MPSLSIRHCSIAQQLYYLLNSFYLHPSVLCLLPVVHHSTMVYKALSEQVKQQKATTHKNAQMRQAINVYRQQEFKPKDERKSYCQVADEFDVSKSTLQHL